MKKILVPTDFSEQANNALQVALQIAQKTSADIILMHVIEPIQSYIPAADGMYIDASVEQKYLDYLNESATKRLNETLKNADFAGAKIQPLIELGNIFQKTKQYVDELQIDLIVMGTHGSSGLDEMFVGSISEKIVRIADCPVLTIREKQQDFKVQKIVFATDLKQEQYSVAKEVQKYQQLFNANLHLLFINTPDNFSFSRDIESKKQEFIKNTSLQNYDFTIYNELNVTKGILHFAEDMQTDMIMLATHQYKGLVHLFSGSFAEDVVNHATCPVLTFGKKYLKS